MTQALQAQEPKKLPKLAGKEADPEHILQRYLKGEKTEDIAKDYDVTRQGLGYWLRTHAEEQWKQAQVVAAIERKDRAEDTFQQISERIETADREERERLNLSLACARDALKSAQWDLERVARRIYGTDQPIEAGKVTISLNLGVASKPQIAVQHGNNEPTVIEGQSQVIDP